MVDQTYFVKSELKQRGWTDGLVKRLLGNPDQQKRNPFYPSKSPMRLYEMRRVERAEGTTEFIEAQKSLGRRRQSARRAVETKLAKLRTKIAGITFHVPRMERGVLEAKACEHYNDRAMERGNFDLRADQGCGRVFLDRITVNFVRHCMTKYDGVLDRLAGTVGIDEEYEAIRERVLDCIAQAYPRLADECQRQKTVSDEP